MSNPTPRRRRSGFTLIELLVVIVILAVIASLIAPNVFKHVGSSKSATARTQIEMLGAALDAYRLDVGRYPTTAEGLTALVQRPASSQAWNGPYLRKTSVPVDPWSRPYIYRSPGEESQMGYDLLSLGGDGQPGGEGETADVKSWQ